MGRFYRHVLVQKRYPHHGAVAFGHYGKLLFEVFKFLGVGDIAYNQPKSLPYPTEESIYIKIAEFYNTGKAGMGSAGS